MTTEALKSTSVTNADATPIVPNTTGEGGVGMLRQVNDYFTPSASMAATSTYRVVRVPTTAKIKALTFESEAQGAGKFDIGVYYSSSTTDGTPASSVGAVVDQDFFASDVDCASLVVATNVTNESTTYTVAKRNQPLWQAVGLTSNPGGNFDIVCTVHTTDITTGTGKVGLAVTYVA